MRIVAARAFRLQEGLAAVHSPQVLLRSGVALETNLGLGGFQIGRSRSRLVSVQRRDLPVIDMTGSTALLNCRVPDFLLHCQLDRVVALDAFNISGFLLRCNGADACAHNHPDQTHNQEPGEIARKKPDHRFTLGPHTYSLLRGFPN
jgi:hypothetical protein